MSIIAFCEKTLFSDTKGIVNKGHIVVFNCAPKIFRSNCNRFAYGKVGVKMSGAKHDIFIQNVEAELISFYAEKRLEAFGSEFCKNNSFFLENFIIITRDRVWCAVNDAPLFDYPNDDYVALGSGSAMFVAGMLLGKTGKQSIQLTIDNCASCGGTVEQITQKSLKPFKIVK